MIRKRVVVVDDDTSMLRSIERLLKVHGFDCVCFERVEDFRDEANLDEAACLVFDINLNNASGIELSKEVARAGHSLPIVFITGADSEAMRSAALKTGCIAYLTKPFPSALLMEAIEKAGNMWRRSDTSLPPLHRVVLESRRAAQGVRWSKQAPPTSATDEEERMHSATGLARPPT